jgi:Protein of unknown function (DUF664)
MATSVPAASTRRPRLRYNSPLPRWKLPVARAKSPVAPLPTQTSRAEVAFAERFVAEAPDLDVSGKDGDMLREVLVHMIEEYARHNGHVDLLRERIDGRVGQ